MQRGSRVGGDSAGGNIAATLALMARDAGQPQLALQGSGVSGDFDFSIEHPSGPGSQISRRSLVPACAGFSSNICVTTANAGIGA